VFAPCRERSFGGIRKVPSRGFTGRTVLAVGSSMELGGSGVGELQHAAAIITMIHQRCISRSYA
jgi:hypothetical protein